MTRETEGIILDIVREAKQKLEDLPGPEYAEALMEAAQGLVKAAASAQAILAIAYDIRQQQESGAR